MKQKREKKKEVEILTRFQKTEGMFRENFSIRITTDCDRTLSTTSSDEVLVTRSNIQVSTGCCFTRECSVRSIELTEIAFLHNERLVGELVCHCTRSEHDFKRE